MLAQRSRGSRREVDLVVDVVAGVGDVTGRGRQVGGAQRAAGTCCVRVQEIVADGALRATKDGVSKEWVQLRQCPCRCCCCSLLASGKTKRRDTIDAHVNITNQGCGVEVGRSELGDTGCDRVVGVNVGEPFR